MRTRSIGKRPKGRRGEVGAGAVEYALLLALIAMVVLGSVAFFGGSTGGQFGRNADCIRAAYEGGPAC